MAFFQLDKALLDIISIKKQPKSKFIGAPVISIWKIKALKSGKSKIIMKYYRDWEGIEKAVENFEVKIIISDK
jgi:predicted secreted protein